MDGCMDGWTTMIGCLYMVAVIYVQSEQLQTDVTCESNDPEMLLKAKNSSVHTYMCMYEQTSHKRLIECRTYQIGKS